MLSVDSKAVSSSRSAVLDCRPSEARDMSTKEDEDPKTSASRIVLDASSGMDTLMLIPTDLCVATRCCARESEQWPHANSFSIDSRWQGGS